MRVDLHHSAATVRGSDGPGHDAHAVVPAACLFAVADGMETAPHGERAAQLAIEAVLGFYRKAGRLIAPRPSVLEETMRQAFDRANGRVWRANAAASPFERMGTTLLCAQFSAAGIVIGSVGDARCYRLRGWRLKQLTRAHVLLEESPTNVARSELDSFESRAIGRRAVVEADVSRHRVRAGDLYLLCSKGLWGSVSLRAMSEILATRRSLDSAREKLVRTASAHGGDDSITAILVAAGPSFMGLSIDARMRS